MTKLNKIAQVLVLSGMSCWVSVAQAADAQISQNTKVNQQIKVSGQVDSTENSAQMSTESKTSAENDSQVKTSNEGATNAEPAANESATIASSQTLENNNQLMANLTSDAGKSVAVALDTAIPATATLALSALEAPTASTGELSNKPTPQPSSDATNVAASQAFDNNNQLITSLSNSVGDNANITSSATATLAQSFSQVTNAKAPALPSTDAPTGAEQTMPSADVFSAAENSAANNIAANSVLESTTSLVSSAQITEQLTGNTASLVTLGAAAQTTQALEQAVTANVTHAISSNAHMTMTENVNGQINQVVTEQVNAELAATTAAEVASSITNDLAIGW